MRYAMIYIVDTFHGNLPEICKLAEVGIKSNLEVGQSVDHFCLYPLRLVNPLSTTGLLTPFLIRSYLEMFSCVAQYGFENGASQTCT